jgi:L-lactate dehydrogenase complex protein LldE
MTAPRVSLFIPCLVDQLYPEMGLATAAILEELGYELHYDPAPTCCGQPAFNAGQRREALKVARRFVDALRGEDPVVCPSGSCTGMVRNYYPVLFAGDPDEERARRLGARTFELSQFLWREGKIEEISGSASGRVAFHNSCHSLRELGVGPEPEAILSRISGYERVEVEEPTCCGFGGLFCAKFPELASAMATTRLEGFLEKGADLVVANDPGCIFEMRQQVVLKAYSLRIVHLAEFVAEAMGLRAWQAGEGAAAGRSR